MADKGSYFSRFFVKVVEIIAAAAATAVSGYLVAHLSGYFPSQLSGFFPSQTQAPAPAAIQIAPRESSMSKAVPASSPAQSAPSVSADAIEQRPAPQQDAGASGAQSVKKSAKAVPGRKQGKGDANKADTTATATTTTESKPRGGEDDESVEARVRAALANVDANRSAPADASTRKADMPGPAATRPVDVSPAVTGVAAPPRAVDVAPQPVPQASLQSPPVQAAPVPPALVQPDPLDAVEIKSRPVATVDTAPVLEPPPPPAEERGVLSALKHMIPDFRRPSTTGEAPRPPAPVGE